MIGDDENGTVFEGRGWFIRSAFPDHNNTGQQEHMQDSILAIAFLGNFRLSIGTFTSHLSVTVVCTEYCIQYVRTTSSQQSTNKLVIS